MEIIDIIAKAAKRMETIEIYYPQTENTKEGWREVEPYSLSLDIGGEHLVYGGDRISPGHIFNAYTVNSKDDHCDSFIIGKIKKVRLTNNKFKPKWPIEF